MTHLPTPLVRLRRFPMAASVAFLLCCSAVAQPALADELTVIELFTSHGCSSCPPADELFGQLIDANDNLIALEFHVDYWNRLVHGSDGNFVDPFSKPAYTARQQRYNQQGLDGRPGVYTPQVVINGRYAAVGSDKRRIAKALKNPTPLPVKVSVAAADGGFTVAVDDAQGQQADVWLIRYLRATTTEITGGENRHLTIENRHVVMDVQSVGRLGDGGSRFEVAYTSDPDTHCAVIVQAERQEPILGAAACP